MLLHRREEMHDAIEEKHKRKRDLSDTKRKILLQRVRLIKYIYFNIKSY